MTVTCAIQARMGSSRLPGKTLADVGGQPLLALMLRRLAPLPVEHLVVATSVETQNDPIEALCLQLGVGCFRGSETDVLARMLGALNAYPADDFIRLTADCPLSDPGLIDEIVQTHRNAGADYTSNTLLRTYPDGLDVEVVRASVLRRAHTEARSSVEREHVTPWVYRHPEINQLVAHRGKQDAGDERWTVDTASDLDNIRVMVGLVDDPISASWTDFLGRWGRHDRPAAGTLRLRPAGADDAARLLAWRNAPDAVEFSSSGTTIDADTHQRWFLSHLDRPATRIWIGCVDGTPIGQVRVDVADAVGTVAVTVDPSARGRGYGTALIAALLRAVAGDCQLDRLRAVIRQDNVASMRAFTSAGFEATAEGDFVELSVLR